MGDNWVSKHDGRSYNIVKSVVKICAIKVYCILELFFKLYLILWHHLQISHTNRIILSSGSKDLRSAGKSSTRRYLGISKVV